MPAKKKSILGTWFCRREGWPTPGFWSANKRTRGNIPDINVLRVAGGGAEESRSDGI